MKKFHPSKIPYIVLSTGVVVLTTVQSYPYRNYLYLTISTYEYILGTRTYDTILQRGKHSHECGKVTEKMMTHKQETVEESTMPFPTIQQKGTEHISIHEESLTSSLEVASNSGKETKVRMICIVQVEVQLSHPCRLTLDCSIT